MLDAREATQSPIMEGLQALLAGTGAAGVKVKGPRRIVIVSDLLQHSEALELLSRRRLGELPGVAGLRAAGEEPRRRRR